MIPVVDLRSDNAAAALRSACEEIGFFTVVGHGVSPAAIDEVAAVSRRFFDQSADAKARFAGPGSVVGLPIYRPLQSERLGATGDGDDHADLKESLDWGPSLAGVDWPAGLQRPYVAYLRELHRLARCVARRGRAGARTAGGLVRGSLRRALVVVARHQLSGARRSARGGAAPRRRASGLRLPHDPAQRRRAGRARGTDRLRRLGSGDADARRVRLQHRRPALRPDRGRVDVDPCTEFGGAAAGGARRAAAVDCVLPQPGRRRLAAVRPAPRRLRRSGAD